MDIKKLLNPKKQNVTFSIKEDVLKRFNGVCTVINLNKSLFIEEAMLELMKNLKDGALDEK